MTRTDCLAAADGHFDDGSFLEALCRRVAYRSESDAGCASPALAQYLEQEMRPFLGALDFDVQVLPNPVAGAGPLLVARRIEAQGLPAVLTYGHGDVVGGQPDAWSPGLSPWQLTVREGKWYGRGTADNKGQHSVNLAGLAAAIEARGGRLGYNVTVLLETGEEAGSPGLQAFCHEQRERLRADLFIGCDGPRVCAGRPTVFLGSRGMVNFSLRLQARQRGYHSGNWGGVISNPATRLANALACLVDARGVMRVDGLRPDSLTPAVRAALRDIPVGAGDGDPPLTPGWGEPGLSAAERLIGWNTLEVLALEAGTPQRPVNAIPPAAVAHCQLRFVVGTRWRELPELLRRHLDAHGFEDVAVELGMQGAATRLDVEHPWVRWACRSMARSCGAEPAVLPNLAGSLPNEVFAETLGLPTLWVPHSYPACGQHGPDEHLLPGVAREGLRIMAGLYWDLGEPDAPWPAPAAAG
ncbi:M20 family metallopeptidase [Orrella sp. JC864]|uniref:M20 family metallopeptidase n=1 Tax=Orrella sp. JC864 TaxID=3120298 RepID=UPI0012BB9DF1